MPFRHTEATRALRLQRDKNRMRAYFRSERKKLSNESRSLLDSALLANTALLPCFQQAKLILFYYPVKGEPNLLPLARHALSSGKRIAFPRSNAETCTMTFHEVSDLSELSIGTYDIPEPSDTIPAITDFSDSICIVPALCFDYFGYRLGYGKGFYDRFLAQYPGITLGLTYGSFLQERLPHGPYDRQVDFIITETGEILPYEAFS